MDRKQALAKAVREEPGPSPEPSGASQGSDQPHEELPPSYTASGALRSSSTSTGPPAFALTSHPPLDYAQYRPESSVLSSNHKTITTSRKALSKSASELTAFIRQQASLPPRPSLCIKGTSQSEHVVDFDIKINLLPYVYRTPPKDPWNYLSISSDDSDEPGPSRRISLRRPQSSNMSLEAWAKAFCSDQSSIKTFTLERRMINFDLESLSGLIRNSFAGLQYKGHLEIKLELDFVKVVVDNQSTKGAGAFFRPLVSAFVGSKDFEVVKAVWPFARSGPEEETTTAREFASISEAAWWKDWKFAAVKAALEKRRGWVTTEDKLEAMMTGWLQDVQVRPWGGSSTG